MIRDNEAWELFEKCKSQHEITGIFDKTDRCHAFYTGDQWRGIQADGESLPVINILKPIVDHKTATIAQNKLGIALNPLSVGDEYASAEQICGYLTRHMALLWEQNKMDKLCWRLVRDAAITGDSYILFYNAQGDGQIIDRTDVFLSDEQEPDLQAQRFIIIKERRFAEDIRREARKNGVDESKIALILPDGDTWHELGRESDKEVGGDENGKLTAILMLWRDENEIVHKCRAVKNAVFEPDTAIEGLTLYPIAGMRWNEKKGSARGVGEVEMLIPNQIEINRQMARMILSSKISSFPRPVYRAGAIRNAADIDTVGAPLEVDADSAQAVGDMVTYLQAQTMSPDALNIWNTLLGRTKDLAGASDAAIGQIDPSTASGTAIIAVKTQAALPLSDQQASYRQLIEDIAKIWWGLWVAYNPNGLTVTAEDGDGIPRNLTVDADAMKRIKFSTRIDVTPDSPYDRYATEQSCEKALAAGYITFEEYVSALDGCGVAPKGKFEKILKSRAGARQ